MKSALALLVLALAATALGPEWVAIEIEPGPFSSGKLYVQARFDGEVERALLDTGSTDSYVRASRFDAYPVTTRTRVKGLANAALGLDVVKIGTVELGSRQLGQRQLNRGGGDPNALIGMDLIGDQPFSLHFAPIARLSWGAQDPPPARAGLKLHKALISLPVELCGTEQRALWDTGAGITLVDRALVARRPADYSFVREIVNGEDGTGKAVRFQLYRASRLVVADTRIDQVPVLASDFAVLHEHLAPELAVVLGYNVIRRLNWDIDPPRAKWDARRPG